MQMPDSTDQAHPHKLGGDMYGADTYSLQTIGLTKDFPGLRALDEVSFDLRRGEVHILFGENGAGKSTLISMIAGAEKPTSGEILFEGAPIKLTSVHQARNLGISAVFQEFSLIPQLTVAQNMFLGAEPTQAGFLRPGMQKKQAEETLRRLEFNLDPGCHIDQLTRAEQQMVEIAKAFRTTPSILILDEPTASLTNIETQQLFKLLKKLTAKGMSIIYITHRMAEIKDIGDRVTILRDGKYIDTVNAKTTSDDELVRLMTGRVVGQIFPSVKMDPGEMILQVDDLATTGIHGVRKASIKLRRGEIVGFAGLVGSGKSEFAQACFGLREIIGGKIIFKSKEIAAPNTRDMLKAGFLYLPSDRHEDGLMMMRPARENISLAALDIQPFSNGLFLNIGAEKNIANHLADRFHLSPHKIEHSAERFSGGNQQKLMLARSLTREFDLIVFDEPTVGVDVGTRAAIYEFIAELCQNDVAILLISSDLPEILNLTHRAYVFYQGKIQAELARDQLTEANILPHFFGKKGT